MEPTTIIIVVNCVLASVTLVVGLVQKVKFRSGCFKSCFFCSSEPVDDCEKEHTNQ